MSLCSNTTVFIVCSWFGPGGYSFLSQAEEGWLSLGPWCKQIFKKYLMIVIAIFSILCCFRRWFECILCARHCTVYNTAINGLKVNLRISKYTSLRIVNVMGATWRHMCCVLARDPRKENHEANKSMGY